MTIAPKNNKSYLIIGIMTGTSMDCIDVSLCEFIIQDELISSKLITSNKQRAKPKINLIDFKEYDFHSDFKSKITELINSNSENINTIKEMSALNFYLADIFAECVFDILNANNLSSSAIDAIAVHGQTIWHEPSGSEFLGQNVSHTYQIFNGSALAKKTDIPVIYDFRIGDVALGGQGAPLVPIFDFNYFNEKDKINALLNIGGIANVTFLNSDNPNIVVAFDTGPGNMLIDYISKKYFNKKYDKNGDFASNGKVIDNLLDKLLSHEYFVKLPPKSTGRELFGEKFIENFLQEYFKIEVVDEQQKYDIIRTVTEFTIQTIISQIELYLKNNENNSHSLNKLIISGGGTFNSCMIERIKTEFENSVLFKNTKVHLIDDFGINSMSKEAIVFAYLGYLFLQNLPGNMPSVTGASKETILGVIAF